MSLAVDYQNMADAIDLAKTHIGKTGKNPSVGCVIVSPDGRQIATGETGKGGAPHAEEAALKDLPVGAARGATAYVTLEPCRKRSAGSLSCSERLLEAGIARVVCAIADRHPKGAGGFVRLVNAGVQVDIGLMREEADTLYSGFFSGL